MLEQNTPFSHLVEFTSGAPTGVFSYSLYDEDNIIVDGIEDEEIAITPGQVSATITIPASANMVSKPWFERRKIVWTYSTTSGVVADSMSYSIRKAVPFPVTTEGVRVLLGVSDVEILDEHIDLLSAYFAFTELFDDDSVLDEFEISGDLTAFKITRAIEAVAALQLLPTLQLALARRKDSGTNQYERWNRIDWLALRASLDAIVFETVLLIDPTGALDFFPIFQLSIRTDPFTGV